MQQSRVHKTFDGLPEMCAAIPTEGDHPVVIVRGVDGFATLPADHTLDTFNALFQVTIQQAKAMVFGSLFGWDKPGANPAAWDENGNLLPLPKAH